MVQGEHMNIAFYIDNISNDAETNKIFECLNDSIKNEKVNDVSLFFNNPGPSPQISKFGFFNSTELWAYTGLLVNTSIQGALYSLKIVNKFKPAYLFKKDRDVMGLIYLGTKMPIFVTNKQDEQEVYRLTGKKPKLVNLEAESLIGAINE
jgi:hypothetical protein